MEGYIDANTQLATPVSVANGGTGASSLTDHGVLVGSGTDPITALTVGTDGQLLIGATGADPAFATPASADGSLSFTTGASTLDIALSDIERLTPGYVRNLGIAYNGGTGVFTVRGSNATLSASNPGYVCLPSKATPGESVLYTITADQSFIDDVGASEILGNLFGTTTAIAWANALPFYLYAVANDAEDTIQIMIGRYPHLKTSPTAALIGAPDDAVADTEASLWSLDNIDETLFDQNPCWCIGSFRMVKSASDDWTVQTLDNQDGINNFNDLRYFNYPLAQNGASTGTFFTANGGTAPVFSTNGYSYKIHKEGRCTIFCNIRNDGGTDGAGAVEAHLTIPCTAISTNSVLNFGSMALVNVITVGTFAFYICNYNVGLNFINFSNSVGTSLNNADFAAGDRDVIFSGTYDLPSF